MGKILFIDDDADFVHAFSIVLEMSGFQVISTSSVSEAFKKTEEEKPDVVVLDVMTGCFDGGFSVARKIRNTLHSPAKLVMLSSMEQKTGLRFVPEDHPDYFQVDCFMERPVSPDRLVQTLRELLG